VLIGCGWGAGRDKDKSQGQNYMAGNPYLHQDDMRRVDVNNGGRYVVAQRASGIDGRRRLRDAARRAVRGDHRLLGFFGVEGGHLPFRTADGNYNPTFDAKGMERYDDADIQENPTLADMTQAALTVLEQAVEGFWLMIEAGDVDWANHANNIDNGIGAVFSGEAAFRVVTDWIEANNAWSYTALIVTSDHGHFFVIDDAERFAEAGRRASASKPRAGASQK
jgi:alkaline phosphatase